MAEAPGADSEAAEKIGSPMDVGDRLSETRLLLLLFAATALPRIVSWMGLGMFGPDSGSFLYMADGMREGRFQEALSLAYHPMYPLLTAMGSLLTGSTPTAGFLVSILLGSAAVLPLFKLTQALFGRPAAFYTALLYAFSSPITDVQADVMTDGPFMFFFMLALWLTWRMAEAPSLEGGVVLGMTASAAFLTRPEGLLSLALAVGWPLAEGLRRGPARARRIGEVLLIAVTILLVLAPFLFWVKAMRGRWGISYRPSAMSAERSVGVNDPKTADAVAYLGGKPWVYRRFGASILRMNLYGALFPFHLLGLAALRRRRLLVKAFFFLVLLAYLAGVLNTLRKYDAMSDRYVMPAMAWMWALAGLGLAETMRFAARRWPAAAWRPAACAALVLALTVLPGLRCLAHRRQTWSDLALVSAWIREQGGAGRPMATSVSPVSYFAGCLDLPLPPDEDYLRGEIEKGVLFFVYTERDFRSSPGVVALLRSSPRLQAPVEIPLPPKNDKVFVQRVR